MADVKGTVRTMIQKGQDPKDYLLEICKPNCVPLLEKLKRCEVKLKNMTNADPELSCMYPFRDWVTCVEGCVKILIVRFNPRFTANSLATNSAASSHDHKNHNNLPST